MFNMCTYILRTNMRNLTRKKLNVTVALIVNLIPLHIKLFIKCWRSNSQATKHFYLIENIFFFLT